MKIRRENFLIALISGFIFAGALLQILSFSGCERSYSSEIKGTEEANLTSAPFVPPPISRNYPMRVIVRLVAKEVVGRLADGVMYRFWTYNGKVPGPFIRVREGDIVEIHLSNDPSSSMPHNIDLHAVVGPGGGAAVSSTPPGHTSIFSFRALHPGLFIYHCATQPVPMHIANGMYGLILVEPREGLPPVDKEYYVMQSEFYTTGEYGAPGLQQFDLSNALSENPSYVVFNGSVGSLVGQSALRANVGQRVRLYVGNIGPNLVSSFHVIGEVFDKVYGEAGSQVTQSDVQTTLIPAGGAVIVEFTTSVPGTYTLVDHSIFRAFNKGCIGQLVVSGQQNPDIFSAKQQDEIYLGDQAINQSTPSEQTSPSSSTDGLTASNSTEDGASIYNRTCIACHQANGMGIPNVFPPLSRSDFLAKNKSAAIEFVLHGHSGPIVVNGKAYNNVMTPQPLNDEEIARVLTFVRTHFGNQLSPVTAEEVSRVRRGGKLSYESSN